MILLTGGGGWWWSGPGGVSNFFGGVSNFRGWGPQFFGGSPIFGGVSNFWGEGLQFFGVGGGSLQISPPPETVNARPVRILLECILVKVACYSQMLFPVSKIINVSITKKKDNRLFLKKIFRNELVLKF